MLGEVAALTAQNDMRFRAAALWGVHRSKVRRAFWCYQGHDIVTWLAFAGDDTRCWYCGQPPQP